MREAPLVLSTRRSFSRFVQLMLCVALLAAGGSSAAVSSPDRAAGSLSLNAGLILTSTSIPGCTPPPSADMCGVRTLTGTLPGLGKVTGAYSYLTKSGPPVCPGILWRAIDYPIHLSIAAKGDLEVAVAEATACVDENSGRTQPQTFTITGGTGIFAGASGGGTLQRTLGNDTCDATSCHRNGVETWAGTLIVPGLEFDVSAPTFSGAASKTVRAKRGARSARVAYLVTASDDRDGTVPAACAPKSGSRFPIGRTTVRCEATDSSANTGTARFTVTVKRPGTVFALLTTGASAAPTPFSLTFEGAHFSDPTMPHGLRHEGRFTASAPFCSSGRAYDTRQIDDGGSLTAWRVHECDDGSGSFTAFLPVVRGEHDGTGSWKVVRGTGRYAQLRGQGTYVGTRLGGDPDDFSTVAYRAQWQGFADFDADPPAIESLSASARKLSTRVRSYTLRIVVTTGDASPITYTVDVRTVEAPLGFKKVTAPGRVAVTLRIQPPRAARSVRVTLTATDVLGNGPTTTSRTIKLAG